MSRPLHAQVEQVTVDGRPIDRVAEPTSDDYGHARTLGVDHDWYKRAVFYEVLVRAFADSNGDGTGDLRGLTEKLDYLQWLGVDCLWLPPFYDSPLRDGGYDIRDFRTVLPEFGTVDDFVRAARRGARARHPGDHRPGHEPHLATRTRGSRSRGATRTARTATTTSGPTTTPRYPDARIIFVDTEPSNWTYDPVRGQFYWHRFFSHQPDLNYDNPAVQEAMIDVAAVLAGPGHRRLPARRRALPVRARGHQLREPARDARVPQALPQGDRRRVPRPGAAGRGQPVAGGRRRVLRRPRGRRRRVPHGVPLPADAAHLHGRAAGVPVPDLGDPGADPGRSRRAASGASSCATTTS